MKKGIYNIIFGIFGQVVILSLGILVPRFVLQSYGDEANGLINAINQIFAYLALIEAGVGQSALQALYKPVVQKDKEQSNAILSATQLTFRKLTYIYLLFTIIIAFTYPMLVEVNDKNVIRFFGSTYWAVVFIILIQGVSKSLSFFFLATLRQLLLADGRNYLIVNITTVIQVITSVLRIILINAAVNIVLLQLVYAFVALLELGIYYKVLKKKYPWLDLHSKPDNKALLQKNAFLVHEISTVIFNSTDVLILSMFCDLKVASIYAIYNLVFSSLNTLIGQIHNGCYYILGQSFNRDKKKYVDVHDVYDFCYIAFVFSVMSATCLLINPFIRLYTEGVTDIKYADELLPILFCLIQLLSCCRITSSNLIKLAGYAKDTVWRAVLEASINIISSIILVQQIGIYGVLLGTIIALLYRTNDMIFYANLKILKRFPIVTYKTIAIDVIVFGIIYEVTKNNKLTFINNFIEFFIFGGAMYLLIIVVYAVPNIIFERSTFKKLINNLGFNKRKN